MPDAHRRDLGRALRASRPDWGGAREALRGQRTALAAALTAEPFDTDAVAAILQEEARLTGTLAERGAKMLMDQIEQMDAEERAAYADAILSERRRPRRGH
jgi:uncharacterized membrane protein